MSPRATTSTEGVTVAPENPAYKEATVKAAKGKCEDCGRLWPYIGTCNICGGFVNAV